MALSRREFAAQSLGALFTYSLLETLVQQDLLAGEVSPIASRWAMGLEQLGQDLKGQKITQVQWQEKVEELYGKVDLPDLLKFIDFEKLARENKLADKGERSIRFEFPEVEGLPKKLVFGKQIFGLRKGSSVVPHGHNNMATAFLMLGGKCHGRHFDRLEDQEKHILIKPTIDREFGPGEHSSISDFKDNIHWFQASTETAYIFNIHVLNVRPGSKLSTGRVYLDPNGEKLKDGTILAPRISYQDANKLYG